MTREIQQKIHAKMAKAGFVSRKHAAVAMGISLPTLARLVKRAVIPSTRYGSVSYLPWKTLRGACLVADSMNLPKSAVAVLFLNRGGNT